VASTIFIAAYALWDKAAVAVLPPILINWGTDTGRALLFTPGCVVAGAVGVTLGRP
jgi:hypothetical protein